MGHVDTTFCAGLDTLVTVVLALKDTTPALCASTKEAAVTYASQITTYLASFTLAQVVLKASDLGLETADSMLKLANFENCAPVVEGMKAEEIVEKKTEEIVEKKAEEITEKKAEEMVKKARTSTNFELFGTRIRLSRLNKKINEYR